ncbi:MAG: universal stress protein [Thermomicrobiales bacterium]
MDTFSQPCDRILIPLDGSARAEEAILHAQVLAASNAQLILLHVLPPAEAVRNSIGAVVVSADDVFAQCRRLAKQNLARAAEAFRGLRTGLVVDTEIAVGDPVVEILRVAAERGVDLIAMVSHGRTDDDGLAFSSVVDRVTRSTNRATLIVHPHGGADQTTSTTIRRLVVPLDGSAISTKALLVAQQFARRLDLSIRLVNVVDPVRDAPPSQVYQTDNHTSIVDQLIARRRLNAHQMLEQVGARLMRDGISATWEVLVGPTVARITETTRPGDIVVLTSHGRTGNGQWPLGGTAEALARRCTVPIVLLRAEIETSTMPRPVADIPIAMPLLQHSDHGVSLA